MHRVTRGRPRVAAAVRRELTRRTMRGAALAAAIVIFAGCAPYRVALFGDVPYSDAKEVEYDRMIGDVNADDVAFSVHVGDFQASTSTCTDERVVENVTRFDHFQRPLVYTPGDNDWTDCGNSPTTRLERLRELVYRGTGTASRGDTTMRLASQDNIGYPENTRWVNGPVMFATLHVVGSNDGVSNSGEQSARRQATIAWMRTAFDVARSRGDKGIVLLAQADLRFTSPEGGKGVYESLFRALRDETTNFAGSVLYVHGDGHTFRNDQPMKRVSGSTVTNFRRVEVYGDPTVRWVRLTVDADGSRLFTISSPPPP